MKLQKLTKNQKYYISVFIGNLLSLSNMFLHTKYLSFIGLFIVLFAIFKYSIISITMFKWYRKYIRRNKIWLKSNESLSYFILNDKYIDVQQNNTININVLELINSDLDFFGKSLMNEIYGTNLINDPTIVEELFKGYSIIENYTNKKIHFTNKEIYKINNRESTINNILNE